MTGDEMARVPYITDREAVPEGQRDHYDSIAESRGRVVGPFAVLLNSPEVAGRVGHLGAYVRYESGLSDAVRELAIITTARELDCAVEWAIHEPIAREAGVSDAAVDAVAARSSTDDLDDTERTVVEYARELFRDHAVSDATFAAAEERFGVEGVTELTATLGYYNMLACVLNAFEVRPESGPELP
ncbi:MAG: carboxymuconolactone decarboxylase family protein [Haloferacaceae archaeon]